MTIAVSPRASTKSGQSLAYLEDVSLERDVLRELGLIIGTIERHLELSWICRRLLDVIHPRGVGYIRSLALLIHADALTA